METRSRVLIIDSESEFIAELQAIIEGKHYRAITASNRTEAQRIIRHEKPDLIILGTLEPRGTAFLLHKWLKRSSPFRHIPLIRIDAFPENQLIRGWTKDEGRILKAECCLSKPIEANSIVIFIDKLLDKTTKRIRVLIADDHDMIRESIRVLLNLQKDIEVVGEAINGRDAINKTLELLPDVVLMDIVMPGMSGLEAAREISREHKEAKILMLTQYDNVENIRASFKAGATCFISKGSASSRLIADIRSVNQGNNLKQTVSL